MIGAVTVFGTFLGLWVLSLLVILPLGRRDGVAPAVGRRMLGAAVCALALQVAGWAALAGGLIDHKTIAAFAPFDQTWDVAPPGS